MTPEGAPSSKFLPNYRHPHIHLGGDKRPVNALKFFWKQERKIHIFPYIFFPEGGVDIAPFDPSVGLLVTMLHCGPWHALMWRIRLSKSIPVWGNRLTMTHKLRLFAFIFLVWLGFRGWFRCLSLQFCRLLWKF